MRWSDRSPEPAAQEPSLSAGYPQSLLHLPPLFQSPLPPAPQRHRRSLPAPSLRQSPPLSQAALPPQARELSPLPSPLQTARQAPPALLSPEARGPQTPPAYLPLGQTRRSRPPPATVPLREWRSPAAHLHKRILRPPPQTLTAWQMPAMHLAAYGRFVCASFLFPAFRLVLPGLNTLRQLRIQHYYTTPSYISQ